MDIIKAFNDNKFNTEINIQGTFDEPLFRASDIGKVLEIVNIRQDLKNLEDSDKHGVYITDSIGREQETTFLTEKGLYKILFRSRKPIAKQFIDWVCEVIKEIRINGSYTLKQEIEELKLSLDKKDTEVEKNLINLYTGKKVLYLGKTEENIIKFGIADDLYDRTLTHKREIGKNYTVVYVIESEFNRDIESLIKKRFKKYRIEKVYSHKNQTELILLNENLTFDVLTREINQIVKLYNKTKVQLADENMKLTEELSKYKTIKNTDDKVYEKPFISGIKKKKCPGCEAEIADESKNCRSCSAKKQSRKVENRPSLEQLEKDMSEMPCTDVGKKYGVCDNSIRNWITGYKKNWDYQFLKNKKEVQYHRIIVLIVMLKFQKSLKNAKNALVITKQEK